jgi:hypothetical protein
LPLAPEDPLALAAGEPLEPDPPLAAAPVCWMTFRFTVDATAAKPQRDGEIHETCSSPTWPATGKMPPVRTTWNMTATTSSGMVLSELLTMAEMSSPRVIETMDSTAMAISSSARGRWCRNEPVAGSFRPRMPMPTRMRDWTALITARISSLETR